MCTLRHSSWLPILLAVAACSSTGGSGEAGVATPRRDANLITSAELADVSDRSTMQAVQLLRPNWLRRTGFRNDLPSVIMDNQRYELDILETVSPDAVESLRFVSPSDATIRWGTGYPSGAIEVRTRRR